MQKLSACDGDGERSSSNGFMGVWFLGPLKLSQFKELIESANGPGVSGLFNCPSCLCEKAQRQVELAGTHCHQMLCNHIGNPFCLRGKPMVTCLCTMTIFKYATRN